MQFLRLVYVDGFVRLSEIPFSLAMKPLSEAETGCGVLLPKSSVPLSICPLLFLSKTRNASSEPELSRSASVDGLWRRDRTLRPRLDL